MQQHKFIKIHIDIYIQRRVGFMRNYFMVVVVLMYVVSVEPCLGFVGEKRAFLVSSYLKEQYALEWAKTIGYNSSDTFMYGMKLNYNSSGQVIINPGAPCYATAPRPPTYNNKECLRARDGDVETLLVGDKPEMMPRVKFHNVGRDDAA